MMQADSAQDMTAAGYTGDEPAQNELRFDIGHLTLPWLTRYELTQFTQSLQVELERLTANCDTSIWAAIGTARIDRLDVVEACANASPAELGRKVAAGLVEKLAGPRGVRTYV
jgi:hypothetical protein